MYYWTTTAPQHNRLGNLLPFSGGIPMADVTVTEQPLRRVESYVQAALEVYDYYLSCGHVLSVSVEDTPDRVWMMRCSQCSAQPKP